ncbi:MAG: chemotaxis protein CheW [Candidatus Obscuribacterales bacterium]|nr:chemotaxis protein CheW [Candidatus Obscuribacterales bacterium]
MAKSGDFLVFNIEDACLAVVLEQVDRVVRAASLHAIPGSPHTVLGYLNLDGVPVPVISLRRKLAMEDKEMDVTDEIIILRREQALFGLLVDEVDDVKHVDSIAPISEISEIKHISGTLALKDGVVLVHDIAHFLNAKEEMDLALALIRSLKE